MPAQDFLKASEEQLLTRADECLNRAGSALEVPPSHFDEHTRLRLFLEAQSCLAEIQRRQAAQTAESDRRRNEEIAERDFRLEKRVVWLIGAEILLSIVFGVGGIYEGVKQGKALDHMDSSTAATVRAIGDLEKAQEQSLTEQSKSLSSLESMNTALQASVRETAQMAEAVQKQLQIVQAEQASRQAELAKKPKLELFVGGVLLGSGKQVTPIQINPTLAVYNLLLQNAGDASATKGFLRIIPSDKKVRAECYGCGGLGDPNSPQMVGVAFDLLRPNVGINITLMLNYPPGQEPFGIFFNVDANEIPAATQLGVIGVTPPNQ